MKRKQIIISLCLLAAALLLSSCVVVGDDFLFDIEDTAWSNEGGMISFDSYTEGKHFFIADDPEYDELENFTYTFDSFDDTGIIIYEDYLDNPILFEIVSYRGDYILILNPGSHNEKEFTEID
jgi:hypothetical protein